VSLLWPFTGTGLVAGFVMLVYVSVILSLLPLGWIAIKRTRGMKAAGPLWPLLFFLVVSSAYAMATPPWQTPDEPRHMEYTELVRRTSPSMPSRLAAGAPLSLREAFIVGDVEHTILRSLRQVHSWPVDAQAVIDLNQIPGPSELIHPPLYYTVAAGLTAPLGDAPILTRLAVLRAFGVMIGGWVVWLCGVAGRLLWPDRRRLAETPMAVAAGVPTFAAFSGSVNSDVLMNLWAAGFLVVLVLLLVNWSRANWPWVVAAIGLGTLGVITKRGFLPLVPVLGLALVFRLRWNVRRLLGALIVLQLVAGAVVLSLPMHVAIWRSARPGANAACEGGYLGPHALCGMERGVSQQLDVNTLLEISNQPATVGFWVHTDKPGNVTLYIGLTRSETVVVKKPGWTFGRMQFTAPPGLRELTLSLISDVPARADGIVLAKGRFSLVPPVYEDNDARRLRWNGVEVANLFENGSVEATTFAAPSWLPANVRRTTDDAINGAYSTFHGQRVSGSWAFISRRLGQTFGIFWGSTGWDQPPRQMPPVVLWALAVVTLGGVVGGVAAAAGRRRLWPARAGALLLSTVGVAALAVFVRGIPPTDLELVSGRYLFPALLAIGAVIAAGWRAVLRMDDRAFRSTARWFAVCTHAAFVVFVFIPFRWL
jgi:hypothetical protein